LKIKNPSLSEDSEKAVVEFLDSRYAKVRTPEFWRRVQVEIANKELTISKWNWLVKNCTEKEIILFVFDGDAYACNYYKNYAHDKSQMEDFIRKGLDPHHLSNDDLGNFYSNEYSDHHYKEINDGRSKLGDPTLDYKIDMILMNQYKGFEFTAEGLQAFGIEHDHFMTIRKCEEHVKKVNGILHKIRYMNARKSGIVDDQNEFIHEIKKYCKKNNISDATMQEMIIQGTRIIKKLKVNTGRNVAKMVSGQDMEAGKKGFVKLVVNFMDSLGFVANDLASSIVKEGESRAKR
jgi:hypothetical protein